ncbi:WSD1 family O-acyltransferase [Mycobacterium deserti]|uniref:WSD1 family O-acyltransferase n=1 Tax=Mycobacterium deserti TaxID=2978347 RepID=A0ABT2M469_9MYCO|nr:WSD1 family O-acyltransferase [Mycobacterium deserti]MCT7657066.1 WSD1 family O-acyltransferase [Mycobacterium deserti]
MPVRRLHAVDAQTYWMSVKVPNDQFLLYGFAGVPVDVDHAVEAVRSRARRSAELMLRVRDRGKLRYPEWVVGEVATDQVVVHHAGSWEGCLEAVARLSEDQLDTRVMTWRLHVFPGVDGVPGAGGGTVAVVQVAHALGDGSRSAALAAYLFGRDEPVPAVWAPRVHGASLPRRGVRAARAHGRLVHDVETGAVPPQADSCPALRSNTRPEGSLSIHTVVLRRSEIAGPTVTVGVLAAVSTALSDHLRGLGDDVSQLRAEVPMARSGARQAHNHFGNVGVGLYPELGFEARVARIAADLACRRRRAAHPAMRAESEAFAAMPAALLRWGVGKFDPSVRSPTVIGNTVVSSVNRGPADLRFGGLPVVVTAGYPGLSPMMGLAHGVHGIGDTVAISVHAAESAIGDIDSYVNRLDAALRAGS